MPTPGASVVYAEWLGAPGAPTALIYGHYDVQPEDPVEQWQSPPFQPTLRDGRLYGRGVSDDKGPMLIPIKVAEAFFAAQERLPINVKFMIEGEEEIGSRHLEAFVAEHRELLAADVVISADGAMWRIDEPSLTVANRGLAGLELTLRGAGQGPALGAARRERRQSPARDGAASSHRCTSPDGRVAVAGFYDQVRELSPAERAEIAALPFDEAAYLGQVGATAAVGEPGYTHARAPVDAARRSRSTECGAATRDQDRRPWCRREAHAKITCRLVPDQEPDEIVALVTRHLEAQRAGGSPVDDAPGRPRRASGAHRARTIRC